MPRVLSVSSSRADIGILLPVWRALLGAGAELHIFLTGMHQAAGPPPDALPPGAQLHRGGVDLGGAAPCAAATAMAAIMADAATVIAAIAPDIMLIVGDRLDMMPAALAAVPFNLPLAHLHGGEITEGALDDRLRHAITKLAHIHCVSSDGARRRLLALGEEEWRIHITGAPGLDTLDAAPAMERREFLDAVGFAEDTSDLRLVAIHPETNASDPAAPLKAVLGALDATSAPTLFTAPNSDPGGAAMRAMIEAFVARSRTARFRDTLGPVLFPNALRHARLLIGNSSSGIVEAGLFGLPVIDVGDRQLGRDRGANVVSVPSSAAAVALAIDRVLSGPARFARASSYGEGKSGPQVAAILSELPCRARLLRKTMRSPELSAVA